MPLENTVVVDLTQYLSGPFGTQILGDLGANVIKIEPPDGDLSRDLPPYLEDGMSSYFLSINRNKKAITIDLKSPSGLAIVHELVERADVVMENFRPGVADRLGVGHRQLQEINPRLVYASLTGFGQDGPGRDLPAFDIIAQAMGGVMSLNGHPGSPSARVGVPIGDVVAGMYATIGVLAGLQGRADTGKGAYIDVSMLDSQLSLLSYLASSYFTSGNVPGPQGRGHQAIPTYRSFTCRDGVEIVIAANTGGMWALLCEALDIQALTTDPRFETAALRLANRHELEPLLEEAAARFDGETLLGRLRGKVPCSRINSVAEALAEPQTLHREMVLDLKPPTGSVARVVGSPIKVAGTTHPTDFPPTQHEHAEEILQGLLGWSGDDVKEAAVNGAFGPGEVA